MSKIYLTLIVSIPSIVQAQDSDCARVTIRLDQHVVLTRTAFRASLTIGNESPQPLSNVSVVLNIRDADGLPANAVFGIPTPIVEEISDVSGGGTILPGMPGAPMEATAEWLLIPTDDAAPTEEPVTYTVGGTLSYITGGNQVTIPLYPAPITVWPDAKLFLKYFLQGRVYSDNPFTSDVVEPAEPFSLGLLMRNEGFGTARNVQVMSSQPRIVGNESGLFIAFHIIGTQVGTQEISPSLDVDLGDIGPAGAGVARWRMTSSFQGQFVEYSATFEHVNSLNIPGLSLIEAVDIFELNHVVSLDGMGTDNLPDFLVNNNIAGGGCGGDLSGAPDDDLPDCVHSSQGPVLPVHTILNAIADGPATTLDQIVMVTAPVTHSGWNYVRLDDPGMGLFNLVAVTRLDSDAPKRHILVGDSGDVSNAWTTHRFLPIDAAPTEREDLVHIFDRHDTEGNYTYELSYVAIPDACNLDADCDDANPCTLDTCALVIGCQHAQAIAGTPCGNPTDSACDHPDSCDLAGVCSQNREPDGTSCSDGIPCNGEESCIAGACSPGIPPRDCCESNRDCDDGNVCNGIEACVDKACVPGTPLDCDDGNPCMMDDCDPRRGCSHDPAPLGVSCGDRNASLCDRPDSCDGLGACAVNHERNGVPCSDGLHCNGDELCQDGVCLPGTPVPDCCKTDAECDNGNVCDGLETCVNHTCTFGIPPVCDDGNPCTDDSCDDAIGCAYTNNTNTCNDENSCTVNDRCKNASCSGLPLRYGDMFPPGGDGYVNLLDITCVLGGFSDFDSCPGADLLPCPPNGNGTVSIDDILAVLSAFSGHYSCPHPCMP